MPASEIRDKSATRRFAARLIEACESSPNVPEYGKGRQVVIAGELGISQEAVRKYFAGESMPKQDKMLKLAKYLDVDVSWLALGETSEVTRDSKKFAGKIADAALMFVGGTIQLAGGNCAFPPDTDPRSSVVDIYAVIKGTKYDINVSSANELSPNVFEMVVPREFKELRCVGCIVWKAPHYDLIELPAELIDRHKVRRSVDFTITVNRIAGRYFTGEDEWLIFKPLGGVS